jgi:hypothetical protein
MGRLNASNNDKPGAASWLKRLGWGAFLFFLLKGIAWLFVFWFGFELFSC